MPGSIEAILDVRATLSCSDLYQHSDQLDSRTNLKIELWDVITGVERKEEGRNDPELELPGYCREPGASRSSGVLSSLPFTSAPSYGEDILISL
ncbi:hypothetical protein RRG08_053377 [Elysia crispata]|uniref:Uncharacterized protein n=1 Tax=Elysia crispata TaxID=231223 RepID=A0AAE0ZH72_9GAST|nr:hypothetical protein RRG08_053377 [Elysia crispata]